MLCSLISGSSGNSSLITYKDTNILIDCGMSGKRLEAQLDGLGVSAAGLDAILVTHEHIDHVCGVGVVSRRYNLPVYATEQTHDAMEVGRLSGENIRYIEPDRPFVIGDIEVNAFCIPHDAAGPVGYRFYCGDEKYAVATDIGMLTNEVFDSISGSRSIILEANHDLQMLKNGSYPQRLKERILSDYGHMSNDLSAQTAVALARRGTKHIMLAHLSNENNTPQIAYDTVAAALTDAGAKTGDVTLAVAKRYEVTQF